MHSRSLLLFYPNQSSAYLLLIIPNSKFIPPHPTVSGNHKFVFYVCENISIKLDLYREYWGGFTQGSSGLSSHVNILVSMCLTPALTVAHFGTRLLPWIPASVSTLSNASCSLGICTPHCFPRPCFVLSPQTQTPSSTQRIRRPASLPVHPGCCYFLSPATVAAECLSEL